jgi:hypothetical protein
VDHAREGDGLARQAVFVDRLDEVAIFLIPLPGTGGGRIDVVHGAVGLWRTIYPIENWPPQSRIPSARHELGTHSYGAVYDFPLIAGRLHTDPIMRPVEKAPRPEIFFRRILFGMSTVTGLAFLLQAAVSLWAVFGFAEVESIIAAHARMWAAGGGLYTDLNHYPFTVSCYGPLLYAFETLGIFAGLDPLTTGRSLSMAALSGVIFMAYRLLKLTCENKYSTWVGTLLVASTANLVTWGTSGRADMLGLFFSAAALERYFTYREHGRRTNLLASAALIAAAIFTKQTFAAAGATIAILHFSANRKSGLRFVFGLGSAGVAVALALNWATDGGYIANAVTANLNPFQASNLVDQLRYFAFTAIPLCLLAAAGLMARKGWSVHPFVLYLAFAVPVFLATAPKIGSDLNYQIETGVALGLCAGLALDRLRFFRLLFAGDQGWVTLLQVPLLLHIVLNAAVTGKVALQRVGRELARQEQFAQLAPRINGPGRLLSVDTDFLTRSNHLIEVEPFIYHRLVDAAIVNPEPVLEDLQDGPF